jgi:hypothetical protein
MSWWNTVYETVSVGDLIYTPGRGLAGGNKKRPFWINLKDQSKIIIRSGNTRVPLVKKSFDTLEDVLKNKKVLWLRIASAHDNEPFKDSADELIRKTTNSQLACGNYICSILEHCGLVKYSIMGNKKVIKLP